MVEWRLGDRLLVSCQSVVAQQATVRHEPGI
jgi:hypothetical protein